VSYSSLGEYLRCGYRFYLERVLGLRGVERPGGGGVVSGGGAALGGGAGLSAAERGVLVHALLEGLDFRRGAAPSASAAMAAAARAGMRPNDGELDEAVAMVQRFLDTELCRRLAAVPELRREEPFSFVLDPGGIVVDGFIDVLARERERTIVVDYKSDRLAGADPAAVAQREYAIQRLVYALAALKGGAEVVEVVHAFLEQPDRPVIAAYTTADADALERELAGLADGVLRRDFTVSDSPQRSLCHGCPGEAGLCSWPLELTRREQLDTLF
jgi:hypothetical protein